MRLQHRLVIALSALLLLSAPVAVMADDAPAAAAAPALPKVCVDAGVASEADCKAFLEQQKAAGEKAAQDKAAAEKAAQEKAAADQAAQEKAAADKAAADKAAQEKAAQDKAAAAQAAQEKAAADKADAEKAAADKAAADQAAQEKAAAREKAAQDKAAEKAAREKAAADKAAADKAAADQAAQEKAAADKAAADKAAADQAAQAKAEAEKAAADKAAGDKAAADKAAADKAALDKTAGEKAASDKLAAEKAAADKAAADKAAADKAAADKVAADKAAADKAAADAAAATPAATPDANAAKPGPNGKPGRQRLAKDCVDAGITTAEDCDALHAINQQKGKPAGQPAADANAPATAPAAPAQPAPATPAPADNGAKPIAPATLPAEVTPPKQDAQKPAEQPAAQPQAPALPDIEGGLTAAAKSFNRSVNVLGKADADPAAQDKARADIKAQQAKIDALCKSNKFDSSAQCLAQFGIELAPVPAEGGGQPVPVVKPVQPVEVIDNLPKGISKQDVAPLLDSAKDQETGKGPGPEGKPAQGQPPVTNTPPPSNDKAAQAAIKPGKITPIDQQQGQQIAPNGGGAPQVQVPQNVTIVNQTVVNNTTTTNVQNNNGAGVQQNNGTPGQQQAGNGPGGRPGSGRPGGFQPGGNGPGGRPGQPGQPGGPQGEPNPIGLGFGVILQLGNQLIINSSGQDQQRIADHPDDNTTYESLPGGRYRETISRPNGVRIVTIYNQNGDVLRRSRFDRNGHEIVLAYFDDRYDNDLSNWRDPGQDLPPLQLHIPARDYVLDADEADEGDVQQFFAQPPVEHVQRLYSIDEVKRSARIRDMVRRLEIGDLTFDTGASTISEDQVGNLSKVAQAMLSLLKKNPAETFLIEGHTDAVGSDIANLRLSDARAATVAQILTDFYHIPPENLATQGYGERFLKVQTDGPEPLNRRVTIRRITPLVTVANQNY